MRLAFSIAFLVGCTAAATDPDAVDNDTGKADSRYPSGIFTSADHGHDGTVGSITLSPDHTFSRTLKVAACPQLDPGCATTTGTYKFSHSTTTSNRYIRFLDASGTLIDRYAYTIAGETLQLRLDSETTFTTLTNIDTTDLDPEDQLCEDDKGNSLGMCPDDFFCQNYVDGTFQCLPPT